MMIDKSEILQRKRIVVLTNEPMGTIEAARLRMSRFSQALKFSDSICEEIFEQRKVSNIVLLNVTNFSKKQKHFYEKKINPICF